MRSEIYVCDVCRKPTERIVAKLNYVPVIPGISRAVHSNYAYHCDIGECCQQKILKGINFRKRETAEQYQARRRRRGEKIA